MKEMKAVIDRLDGYLRCLATVYGEVGNVIASAYLANLDTQNLTYSLKEHYDDITKPLPDLDIDFGEYSFDEEREISNREFYRVIENHLHMAPFGRRDLLECKNVEIVRKENANTVIEFLSVIKENTGCKRNVILKMERKRKTDLYKGKILVFPLEEESLLLIMLHRVQ